MTRRRRLGAEGGPADALRADEGSSLVEIAVTAPVLFLLIFAFMELCLLFYSRAMISEAAREGTRYAMFRGPSCTTTAGPSCTVTAAQVNAYVSGLGWPNFGGGTMTPSTTFPNGQAVGSPVQVTVTYVFRGVEPFVPHTSFTMKSTSVATILQ